MSWTIILTLPTRNPALKESSKILPFQGAVSKVNSYNRSKCSKNWLNLYKMNFSLLWSNSWLEWLGVILTASLQQMQESSACQVWLLRSFDGAISTSETGRHDHLSMHHQTLSLESAFRPDPTCWFIVVVCIEGIDQPLNQLEGGPHESLSCEYLLDSCKNRLRHHIPNYMLC